MLFLNALYPLWLSLSNIANKNGQRFQAFNKQTWQKLIHEDLQLQLLSNTLWVYKVLTFLRYVFENSFEDQVSFSFHITLVHVVLSKLSRIVIWKKIKFKGVWILMQVSVCQLYLCLIVLTANENMHLKVNRKLKEVWLLFKQLNTKLDGVFKCHCYEFNIKHHCATQ